MQAAAVCFQRKRGIVEFLLVQTTGGKWTFPKGHVHGDEPEWETARRKAHAEAGAIGEIRRERLATYFHISRHGNERSVAAYLLEVERTDKPLEQERNPRWFAPDEAVSALPEDAAGVVKEALKAIGGGKQTRDLIFVSYAHKDERICKEFLKMIRPTAQKYGLKIWSDQEIKPGAIWRDEIDKALAHAKIAVLFVSPDFLNSDFITRNELPPLLSAAAAEGVRISWIPCTHSNVEDTEIIKFQALMPPDRPLAALRKAARDKELYRISQQLPKMTLPA